jgi:hypothetical protein
MGFLWFLLFCIYQRAKAKDVFADALIVRRDKPTSFEELTPGDQAWCVDKFKSSSIHHCLSWGDRDPEYKKGWQDRRCGSLVVEAAMERYFGDVHSRTDALQRIESLGLSKHVIHMDNVFANPESTTFIKRGAVGATKISSNNTVTLLGTKPNFMKYEMKFPWSKFTCPGTVAIDLGTQYGDSTFPMAAALEGGVVLGVDVVPCSYVIIEWAARLNPHLKVIPYNFGVINEGEGEDRFIVTKEWMANVAVFTNWLSALSAHKDVKQYQLLQHTSFLKIDLDGRDFKLVETLKSLQPAFRPLILIEWYPKDDKSETNGHRTCDGPIIQKLWKTVSDMNYAVYDWSFTHRFNTCKEAYSMFQSARAKDMPTSGGSTECGTTRNVFDLCDLLLVPADIDPSNRKSKCPRPMSPAKIEALVDAIKSANGN